MKNNKNVFVLPTDKPSRLYINARYKHYEFCELPRISTEYKKCHNIYITNDEEIKEGDWFYSVRELIEKAIINYPKGEHFGKIILTTDQVLISNDVQPIDDEFLEWFVAHPICEEVEVENERIVIDDINYNFDVVDYKYKIIIPKEEPKQETLEEAAEKEYPTIHEQYQYDAFIEGAKWQAERMYSEEEVKKLAFDFYYDMSHKMGVAKNLISENATNVDEWFKQFKKK